MTHLPQREHIISENKRSLVKTSRKVMSVLSLRCQKDLIGESKSNKEMKLAMYAYLNTFLGTVSKKLQRTS